MKVTQSLLGAFMDCGLKAQFTIERPSWFKTVGSAPRAVGTGYHASLEYIYTAIRDGLPWSLEAAIGVGCASFTQECETDSYTGQPVDQFMWNDTVPDELTAFDFIEFMVTTYVTGGHVWPEDWKVAEIEARHIVEMDGFTNSFACDLVLWAPDGGIVAVDNKTAGKAWPQGKEHPRKNQQACMYVAGLKEIYPDAAYHRFVFDVMTYPGKKTPPRFERRISDPEPHQIEAVLRRAREFSMMWDKWHIGGGMDLPANPASTLCSPKFCDHFDGCAYGAVLEQPVVLSPMG